MTTTKNDKNTEIKAKLSRILYVGRDNWKCALMVREDGTSFSMAGTFDIPVRSKWYSCIGRFETHPKYGQTFACDYAQEYFAPANNAEGMYSFLSSGLIKGIGPSTAKKIIDRFGDECFDVLERDPSRYLLINGISQKKLKKIIETYNQHIKFRKLYTALLPYGITPHQISRAAQKYGTDALDIIMDDPYRLYADIDGIGFLTADEIGEKVGIPRDSIKRVKAIIIYAFEQSERNGHMYMTFDDISKSMHEIEPKLDLESKREEVMKTLIDDGEIVRVISLPDVCYYLAKDYRTEESIAHRISLLKSRESFCSFEAAYLIGRVEDKLRKDNPKFKCFDELQKEAILNACRNTVSIITGGPGTGKTSTIIGVITGLKEKYPDIEIVQCAPTGKAAKRMNQQTGLKASTMHRMLSSNEQDAEPFEGDVFIIDETSMIDSYLFSRFLLRIPLGAKIIIIGDTDQLPSIGPGMCLSELIASEQIPCIYLDKIYRQKGECGIIETSQLIKRGTARIIDDQSMSAVKAESEDEAYQKIISEYENYIAQGYNQSDIIVLCPFRAKRTVSVGTINDYLSEKYNGNNPSVRVPLCKRTYHEHDRVMHTKNSYDLEYYENATVDDIIKEKVAPSGKGIFNGDCGTIIYVNALYPEEDDENVLIVKMDDGKLVLYTENDIACLDLCFATTIHKSQGAEFPVVIVPVLSSQAFFLERSLVYTAITRASKKCVVIGDGRAFTMAVKKASSAKRRTKLAEFIREK